MVKRSIKIMLLIMVFGLIFNSFIFADTVYLKNGEKIKGKIIKETDEYIILLHPKNKWRIVYHWVYIDKIEYGDADDSEEPKKTKENKE